MNLDTRAAKRYGHARAPSLLYRERERTPAHNFRLRPRNSFRISKRRLAANMEMNCRLEVPVGTQ